MRVVNCLPSMKQATSIALGVFDGVHIGHQAVIREAVKGAAEGLCPVVFTFDLSEERPKQKQGQKQILSDAFKQKKIAALGAELLLNISFHTVKDFTPEYFVTEILLKTLHARRVVCGFDFRFGKNAVGDVSLLQRLCTARGIEVVVIPPMLDGGEPVRSTRIRRYLSAGDIEAANRLLGYEFIYAMPVVNGLKNGKKWGFPTINQKFSSKALVPKFGVYASHVLVDGVVYGGITNIGVKPTIEGKRSPLSETYIIGMEQELYGKTVPVSLFYFLRGEKKFNSVEDLTKEVQSNIETVSCMIQRDGFAQK